MNTCRDIAPDLSALVDGELPPARQAAVAAHAASCPHCRQRLAELRELAAGLAALPKLQPAPQFLADVRRQIRSTAAPAIEKSWVDTLFRPAWLKLPVEVTAVVAVLVAVTVWVRAPRREGEPTTVAMNRPVSGTTVHIESPEPVAAATPAPAAPLPSASAVVVKQSQELNEKRATGSVVIPKLAGPAGYPQPLATAGGFAAGAPSQPRPSVHADGYGYRQPAETVVIRADDAVLVQAHATTVAASLGGQVSALNRPGGQAASFLVDLPLASVAQFKSQLHARMAPAELRGATANLTGNRLMLQSRARPSRALADRKAEESVNKLAVGVAAPAAPNAATSPASATGEMLTSRAEKALTLDEMGQTAATVSNQLRPDTAADQDAEAARTVIEIQVVPAGN